MVRRALLPWLNAFKFLYTYAEIDNWRPEAHFSASTNIMDQWILSRLESLKKSVVNEMEGYRLYNVMPSLFEFIEDLTNWYIRLNRARFWTEGTSQDKLSAYHTLYEALVERLTLKEALSFFYFPLGKGKGELILANLRMKNL